MALADEQAVLGRVMEQQQLNSTVEYGLVVGEERTIGERGGGILKDLFKPLTLTFHQAILKLFLIV